MFGQLLLNKMYGNYSVFRIYEVQGFENESDWRVTNHQTYVMNLIIANNTNKPTWELEYDACKAFNMTDLNHNNWSALLNAWLQYIKREISAGTSLANLNFVYTAQRQLACVCVGESKFCLYNTNDS